MATEQFCLRWNDFHANITAAFSEIKEDEDFLDVTLVSTTPNFSTEIRQKCHKCYSRNISTVCFSKIPILQGRYINVETVNHFHCLKIICCKNHQQLIQFIGCGVGFVSKPGLAVTVCVGWTISLCFVLCCVRWIPIDNLTMCFFFSVPSSRWSV